MSSTLAISAVDESHSTYKSSWRNNLSCSKQSRSVAVNEHLQVFVSSLGRVCASRLSDLAAVWQAYNIKDRAETIRFSADGCTLAIGCQDCCIYVFEVAAHKGNQEVLSFRSRLFGH